ncbi:MAG: EF-hand domain-containing protein [Sphingobium sp.]
MMITGAVLAFAVPAMAQQTPAADPAATPGGAAQQTQPAQPAQPAQPGQPAQSAQPAQPAQANQVAAIIESEYPVYDADKSGELDQAEFSKWILALKQQEMQATGKAMAPEELTAWAAAAFQNADADKNGTVSRAELTTYLGG